MVLHSKVWDGSDKIWACLCGSGDKICMAHFSLAEEHADEDMEAGCDAECHMKVHVTLAIADDISKNINPDQMTPSEYLNKWNFLKRYSVGPVDTSPTISAQYVDTYSPNGPTS